MFQPVVSGVYMLFQTHKLVYVGKSKDCYRRIDDHRANGRAFDYATVTSAPEADMGWIEAAMIAAMEPVQNRAGKAAELRARAAATPRVIVREVPAAVRTENTAVGMPEAREIVRAYGFSPAKLKGAITNGELAAHPKGSRRGPGALLVVLYGPLIAWCEARQAERVAAA